MQHEKKEFKREEIKCFVFLASQFALEKLDLSATPAICAATQLNSVSER